MKGKALEDSVSVGRHTVLVIGGGVSGQRAALNLANAGIEVVLLEKEVSLGGTTAQLGMMFPQQNCLLCRGDTCHGAGCTRPTISPELLDFSLPPNLHVMTSSQLTAFSGTPLHYRATIQHKPRYVQVERCIKCDRCAQVCPQELPDEHEAGLAVHKAAYRPSFRSVPDSYAVAKGSYCESCGRCVTACPTGAIDLTMVTTQETIEVSAVVVATGMQLYDARLSQEYGYGRFANVVTGLEMERMTSPEGPGEGRVVRRSDGQPPKRIAWLQCVGSRDKEHDYCSAFCCGYATRQAVQARTLLPDSSATIYLMDDRVYSKGYNHTYDTLRASHGIRLSRNRPSVIYEDKTTKELVLQVTDDNGQVVEERHDLVVLSIGAQSAADTFGLAQILGLQVGSQGYLSTNTLAPVDSIREGIFVAGTTSGPADLADSIASGAAAAARIRQFLGFPQSRPAAATKGAPAAEAHRVGVFVCDCAGEISRVIDLHKTLDGLAGTALTRVVPLGCFPEGLAAIRESIAAHNLTDVVIGACNRRTYSALFKQELGVPVELVSLREECAFVHSDDPPGATNLAGELLRMGIERAARQTKSEPEVLSPLPTAMVLGGGLAGMTAALYLADSGIPVHLVEREANLGGFAFYQKQGLDGLEIAAHVRELSGRVASHPHIILHLGTMVASQSGRPGHAAVALAKVADPSSVTEVAVGATIIATGSEEYRGPAYGLGTQGQVYTLADLDKRLTDEPDLPKKLGQVAFIGCTGPWDEPGSSEAWRCSRTCCADMLSQAMNIKKANPGCQVFVLEREINMYGLQEASYTEARRMGIVFIHFSPTHRPDIASTAEGLRLVVLDSNLREEIELKPDLVVLASATVPHPDTGRIADQFGIHLASDGFLQEWEVKTQTTATFRPDVFICGAAQGPKQIREIIAQSLAAADQALTLLTKQPANGQVIAKVDKKACVACLTCVRVCPYHVPRMTNVNSAGVTAKSYSYIDPLLCQGCGRCVSECPGMAIQLSNNDEDQLINGRLLGQWLGSPRIEQAWKPEITVLTCQYCGNVPVEMAGALHSTYPATVKVEVLPCAGRIDTRHLLSALEQGADGVLVVSCPPGNCHHVSGNQHTLAQIDYARSMLNEVGLEGERLHVAQMGVGQGQTFADLVSLLTTMITALGPNPARVHTHIR
ncbi:MAG: FAD-dependent oxidoreductase [Anaerolineae bacterium]